MNYVFRRGPLTLSLWPVINELSHSGIVFVGFAFVSRGVLAVDRRNCSVLAELIDFNG